MVAMATQHPISTPPTPANSQDITPCPVRIGELKGCRYTLVCVANSMNQPGCTNSIPNENLVTSNEEQKNAHVSYLMRVV